MSSQCDDSAGQYPLSKSSNTGPPLADILYVPYHVILDKLVSLIKQYDKVVLTLLFVSLHFLDFCNYNLHVGLGWQYITYPL